MELKINSQIIVAERKRRAWSQQHLADATGLALRTIQRIETTGTGSYESLRALASCLEVPATNLRVEAEASKSLNVMRSRSFRVAGPVFGASLLAGLIAFLWLGTASAKQIAVDFGLTVDRLAAFKDPKTGQEIPVKDTTDLQYQLLLSDGKKKEQLIGEYKLVLTPTIQNDGRIALSARLYEKRDSGFEILAAPELMAVDGKEAEVEFSFGASPVSGPQRSYRITFKPKIQ